MPGAVRELLNRLDERLLFDVTRAIASDSESITVVSGILNADTRSYFDGRLHSCAPAHRLKTGNSTHLRRSKKSKKRRSFHRVSFRRLN